ncbi:RICIN domain-containing protein [Streptomyces sp. NPDC047072]|uniref:RICIN domain-containing protein n=1 Tax=Streptomyces sp. NPDC047072 TaxID=3154809 RepID=UPI0033F2FD0B
MAGTNRYVRKRRWWAGAVTLAVSTGLMAVNAPTASAEVAIGTNLLRDKATGRCLDSRGSLVYTLPCQSGNDHQTWTVIWVTHTDYDIVRFQNKATGYCLSWSGYTTDLPTTWTCATGDAITDHWTRWKAVGSNWDEVQIKDERDSADCVDSNAAGDAYLLGCNGGDYQKWHLG